MKASQMKVKAMVKSYTSNTVPGAAVMRVLSTVQPVCLLSIWIVMIRHLPENLG